MPAPPAARSTARAALALAVAVSVIGACQPAVTASPPPASTAGPATAGPTAPTTPGATAPATAAAPSAAASPAPSGTLAFASQVYPIRNGAHPHDVAPASDGGVWYTGQQDGTLGWLDPATGEVREVDLGAGAAPHGVITGPDGAAWVTDQGLDAIVRVTPGDFEVTVFQMPAGARDENVHTGVFDLDGVLWFTGQRGIVARLDPATGEIRAFDVPRGFGPYGIAVTPSNEIWFVSLSASYLGRVDKATGAVEVVEPPTAGAGTRRVWSDSTGRLWVSYWNAGKVAVYDPADASWREWDLPGRGAQAYSVYVDELDAVWLTDFGANEILRFDPLAETFVSFPSDRANAAVRQMLGRPGEAWGAESGTDRLVVIRYGLP